MCSAAVLYVSQYWSQFISMHFCVVHFYKMHCDNHYPSYKPTNLCGTCDFKHVNVKAIFVLARLAASSSKTTFYYHYLYHILSIITKSKFVMFYYHEKKNHNSSGSRSTFYSIFIHNKISTLILKKCIY